MIMYLTEQDFYINDNKLNIIDRKGMVIVCFMDQQCPACTRSRNLINALDNKIHGVRFGIVTLLRNEGLLNMLKETKINIEEIPKFALFSIGIFNRFINLTNFESIFTELRNELMPLRSVKDKKRHLKLSEM